MRKETKFNLFSLLWGLAYLASMVAIIVSSISLFNNFYYESIFVSGSSMNPTLSGDASDCDYGIIDKSEGAKRALKRYQIVTTYYSASDVDYKIKRVVFLPGETFKVVNNDLYLYKDNSEWLKLDVPYQRTLSAHNTRNYQKTTLNENEYFLFGDNYTGSLDSYSVGPINFDLLVGVVVKMEGKCTIKDGKVVEKRPSEPRYFLGVDF